jgi:hypothetical protein
VTRWGLIDALLKLEKAAALVESYLPLDNDPALLLELLNAWGPPPRKPNTTRSRELQLADWLYWLRDCGQRWEARPPEPHPAGEEMGGASAKNPADLSLQQ